MRTTIQNYIAAEKARREENGEKGFSLIELIIVVVILGILAAIAIPVFLNIQNQAAQNSLDAVAANAASQLAAATAQSANGNTVPAASTLGNLDDGGTITFTVAGTTLDAICVTATSGGRTSTGGPGCP